MRPGATPLRALTTLTKKEKQELLDAGIILCREICDRPEKMKFLKLSESRRRKVLEEAKGVCHIQ
ncbi:MAG: hypothetical protein U5L96_07000 [Owenweeksia sp.]|nr:hypothetical protein [Owenweeksia sp.]